MKNGVPARVAQRFGNNFPKSGERLGGCLGGCKVEVDEALPAGGICFLFFGPKGRNSKAQGAALVVPQIFLSHPLLVGPKASQQRAMSCIRWSPFQIVSSPGIASLERFTKPPNWPTIRTIARNVDGVCGGGFFCVI